jgi:hypothetical protein
VRFNRGGKWYQPKRTRLILLDLNVYSVSFGKDHEIVNSYIIQISSHHLVIFKDLGKFVVGGIIRPGPVSETKGYNYSSSSSTATDVFNKKLRIIPL